MYICICVICVRTHHSTNLLDVLSDELEDKPTVHERQQVMQEKCKACVQTLDQRGLLQTT